MKDPNIHMTSAYMVEYWILDTLEPTWLNALLPIELVLDSILSGLSIEDEGMLRVCAVW